MAGINKAIIVGNLGDAPKVNQTNSGKTVANFTVATSKKFKQADGSMGETTQWHRIVAWNKLAEIVRDYCRKGSKVYVEGEIETRSYDKDSETKYVTEIIAQQLQLLDSKKDTQPQQGYQQPQSQSQGYGYGQAQQASAYQPQQSAYQQAPAQAQAPVQPNYQAQVAAQLQQPAPQAQQGYIPQVQPSGIKPTFDEQGQPLQQTSEPAFEPDQIPF